VAGECSPDVILMDVGMPKLSGVEATKRIKAKRPSVTVLVLTVHDEDEYIQELLRAGAAGYILKTAYAEELVNAIRAVSSGDYVFTQSVGEILLKSFTSHRVEPGKLEGIEKLTAREFEVLKLAATGMSNKDIASSLGIGTRTVKGHLIGVFGKMGVGSRTEAVLVALKQGLISLEDLT